MRGYAGVAKANHVGEAQLAVGGSKGGAHPPIPDRTPSRHILRDTIMLSCAYLVVLAVGLLLAPRGMAPASGRGRLLGCRVAAA